MSVVISAKVPRQLKERARRAGIPISELVRRTLEVEVAKVEQEKLRNELDDVSRKLKGKISTEDVVKAVRSSRDKR
jgi:antitoxin CcdA